MNYFTEQLGISSGAARHTLVQSLLLAYATKLGCHICYKCGLPVESINDMSIDHRIPWRNENNAIDLFFDLDNIAITHKPCNTVDRPHRKECPVGMSWCGYHKASHLVEEFSPGLRWNGLDGSCKEAHRLRAAAYEAQNPRFSCPECGTKMRKVCRGCGYDLPMARYMALRRSEGVGY